MQKVRSLWLGLYVANWIIIAAFWLHGSMDILVSGVPGFLLALGRLTGLTASYFVLMQFFLMGRFPWLERAFGLDTLSRMHGTSGKRGLGLLLLHPIFLIAASTMVSENSVWSQVRSFFFDYQYVDLAALGLVLFMVVGGTSFAIAKKHFRYESWYFVHLLAYIAVFVSFGHQIVLGEDLLANRIFYGYWIALYVLVFASTLIFRVARPMYRSLKHGFKIARVVPESPSAVSLYISGKDIATFPIRAGQFMIIRLLTRGGWWQAHPFSLSMTPNGEELRITVKELGDFTRSLRTIAVPGTKVFIDGPYGIFTDIFGGAEEPLLIAGGIGITPLRSLFEDMLGRGKKPVLLYGNRTKEEIVFRDELAALASKHGARVVHVLSDEPSEEEERGYIDAEKILRLVPDFMSREVYLCGPPVMMDKVRDALVSLGFPEHRIRWERFSLGPVKRSRPS